MASTIYNHRTLQPTGGPPPQATPSHVRLNEYFESIRQEFDAVGSDAGLLRAKRDEYESAIAAQINELNTLRQALYDLEGQHHKVRQQYDSELNNLRVELAAARANGNPTAGTGVGIGIPPPSSGSSSHVGPGSGSGGGILGGPPLAPSSGMAGIPSMNTGGGPSGYPDPYYGRGDTRDRDRDERDRRERGRDRDRDRERDRGDRGDRDRERERERDRQDSLDQRDPKRLKTERDRVKGDRDHPFSPGPPISKLPTQSSTPLMGGPGLPLPPPLSQPSHSQPPHISASSASAAMPPGGPAHAAYTSPSSISPAEGFLEDIDPRNVPPELKKEGSDWFAVFNPKVKRVLDINLTHALMHESVVCCVRFSADGKYLATGCNRTAQIYDTKTGTKTCVLMDQNAAKSGDLYIRSVCFSPDGKYLATGAEDKQIRIWDIAKRSIRNIFDGHQQEIYSLDFSLDGRLIVSGSGDKTARIWNMTDGVSKVLTINDPDSVNNDAGVTSVAISPNGQLVAAGSLDTVVRIWDVNTGELVDRLRGHLDSVYSVAFTPDGKGLVSGSLDKTLKYWDVSGLVKGKKDGIANGSSALIKDEKGSSGSPCTMNFTGHKDYVLSVAVSHDGKWVVSGSKDRGVQFWDANSAIWQCMLQGHKNSVISIDLSPAGNVLATGSGDWQARIWSYNTL